MSNSPKNPIAGLEDLKPVTLIAMARAIGVSEPTARAMVRAGTSPIKPVRLGKRDRFLPVHIRAYLEGRAG